MIEDLDFIFNYVNKKKFTLKAKALMFTDEILHIHEWNIVETDIDNPNQLSIVRCKKCSLIASRKAVDNYYPPAFKYFVENNVDYKDACRLRYIKNIIE